MAGLTEVAAWEALIYQLEEDDPVQGGPNGIDNLQAKQLANRTLYLKQQVEGKVAAADKSNLAQAQAGTDDTKWMTPYLVAQAIQTLANIAQASETVAGKVELATPAETIAGTDTARAVHPAGALALINNKIAALVNSSPSTLDTLNELATALGNDPNFATTMSNLIGTKAPITSVQKSEYTTAAAGGTADAITAAYAPAIASLSDGLLLTVRAAAANTATAPTFTPASGVIAAKAIVKGNAKALVPGDISGAGHPLQLRYDVVLDKWTLLNPATGITDATPFANAAEAQAMTDPAKALSPATLDQALKGARQVLNATTGRQELPGGLILQWVTPGAVQSGTLSWEKAFPNGILCAIPGMVSDTASYYWPMHIRNATLTSVTFYSYNAVGGKILALGF